MGNRVVPAFLLIALLVPLPKAISAPFQAASSPFVDVPAAGTVQAAVGARRFALFRGLDAFSQQPPSSAPVSASALFPPAPTRPRPAALEAAARSRTVLRATVSVLPAAGPDEALAARRTYAAHITAQIRHKVAEGDTLFALALRYNTTVEAIVAVNALPSAHVLRIGQELIMPVGASATARAVASPAPRRATAAAPAAGRPAAAITYEVQTGDTLFALALRYNTTVDAIVAANGLPSAHRLRLGQRLAVPVGKRTAPRALTAQAVSRPTPTVRATLSWPARGVITSRYGWRYRRHHDGIDLASPRGTPIYAARAGRVAFAGWYYGYGRAVIVDHGGGLTTLYGHASKLLARTGQVVEQGQLIALVGCTGRCTGSHLHFEVRINRRAVNPLPYLR